MAISVKFYLQFWSV